MWKPHKIAFPTHHFTHLQRLSSSMTILDFVKYFFWHFPSGITSLVCFPKDSWNDWWFVGVWLLWECQSQSWVCRARWEVTPSRAGREFLSPKSQNELGVTKAQSPGSPMRAGRNLLVGAVVEQSWVAMEQQHNKPGDTSGSHVLPCPTWLQPGLTRGIFTWQGGREQTWEQQEQGMRLLIPPGLLVVQGRRVGDG